MPDLLQEVRHVIRRLRKSPGFALVSMLTLALGIGATTAVFSVVEAVLLRPLPFHDPDGLVSIHENVPQIAGVGQTVPAPDAIAYSHLKSFDYAGGYQQFHMEISGIGESVRVMAARANAGVFPALGVQPLLGRTFSPTEDEQGSTLVVLSYALWSNFFHADRKAIGKTIDIERKPYTIIGVMPRSFEFPITPGRLSQTQFWVPMSFTPDEKVNQSGNWDYGFVARLKPGTSLAQANAEANQVAAQIVAGYPSFMHELKMTASVTSLKLDAVAEGRPLVRILFFAVLVVLLIACANLAGLLLVRAIRRRHEISVQVALGAPSGALIRQSLLESLVISLAGGAAGIFLASIVLNSWVRLLPETLPRISEISLNPTIIAFALGVSLLTGLICGIAPAFAALRTTANHNLNERQGTTSAGHSRLRSLLVVTEIATALVLLTTAGLLLRSFEKMRAVDPGFRPERLVIATYSLPDQQYKTRLPVDAFNHGLLERLRHLPGTESAALITALPMSDPTDTSVFLPEGYTPPPTAGGSSIASMSIGSFSYTIGDYFHTAGIPLLAGRFLADSDDAGTNVVAVVNRSLAAHYWPHQSPLGKRIKLGTAEMDVPWVTVVGEVADTKQGPLDSHNLEQIYIPLAQTYHSFGSLAKPTDVYGQNMRVVMRTSIAPEEMENTLRQVVRSLDPQLPLTNVRTMEDAISESEGPRRFHTTVLAAFALGAVLLAILGIYSVITFSVLQRVHEMAVRFALGAQPGQVIWLVLSTGLKLGVIGCAVGLVGAMASTRLLKSLLFEVSPLDPLVFAFAAVIVLCLSVVASSLPARRAASIDPMQLLRSE